MPSFSHHNDSVDSPPVAVEANGGPLSDRIASGRPNSQNASSNTGRTWPWSPRHRLAAQQAAAPRIAQRQGIAARPIAGPEPALEVDRPYRIRFACCGERLRMGRALRPTAAFVRQAPLGQPIADRARRRQLDARTQLAKLVPPLLGAPAIMRAQRQYIVHQLRLTRPAMFVRRPAAVLQTLHAFALIPPQQPVPRLTTDAGLRTQLRHHRPFLLRRQHKPHPLFHDAGLFPRHRQALLPSIENLSTMYPVQTVSYLSGPYPHLTSPPRGRGT